MTARWETFEREVLIPLGGAGNRFRMTGSGRGGELQAYLAEQRRPKSRARFVLSRKGRTSAAVWTIGARSKDANRIVAQFGDDVKHRILRAIEPDLARIGELNPRAVPLITTALEPAVDSVIGMIDAMLAVAGMPATP